MTERVTIKEAAELLGVSQDTIRRRLKHGDLAGEREKTPQGFVWRVELPQEYISEAAVGEPSTQDGDRHTDSPTLVADLLASKDEMIFRLDSEVAYLRDQLDQRSRELAAERERSDVIQQLALNRIPPLPSGESRGPRSDNQSQSRTEAQETPPEGRSGEITPQTSADTSQSETAGQPRRWWEWWKR